MSDQVANVFTVSTTMDVPHSAAVIWPLLCPVKEYDWIEIWDCEVLHTKSGVNELGCVFKTSFPKEGPPEIWVTSRFDPYSRLEFIRTNADRAIRFEIALNEVEAGTQVTWTHHVTPLNEAGMKYLEAKPDDFQLQMTGLNTMLIHYLDTGTMLRGIDIGLLKRIKTHVHSGKTG